GRDRRQVAGAGLGGGRARGRREAATRLGARGGGAAVNPQPCLDERADQPRPRRALVVGAVSLAHAAAVVRRVAGLAGGQRARAQRREQLALGRLHDLSGLLLLEERERQAARGEELLG